ncbi:hypothetical protein CLCR_03176 [Cladophialophora carrionii]|uniref:Uncharacterized protein n=1 Tax=Cladophialophora carrionii TaxID=86049 RepID=A0A1C1D1M6_9EURO|nr:hypothetical protein CLCR_03176 [Cladophialophora carrionii]
MERLLESLATDLHLSAQAVFWQSRALDSPQFCSGSHQWRCALQILCSSMVEFLSTQEGAVTRIVFLETLSLRQHGCGRVRLKLGNSAKGSGTKLLSIMDVMSQATGQELPDAPCPAFAFGSSRPMVSRNSTAGFVKR